MNTDSILAILIAERNRLSLAIEALQGPTKRRGRPPKNPMVITLAGTTLVAPAAAPAPKKNARKFSAAQRKAQAERMKSMWAAKRAAEPKAAKNKKSAKTAE
jgi:hypothetical protein